MLDIHPAHHAATTWRDFFIHIATIVIGLMIAVGLEQTVEHIHHHILVRETREALRSEREDNRQRLAEYTRNFHWESALLQNNMLVLTTLQQHPGTPPEKLPGILVWTMRRSLFAHAAWDTAQQDGVLAFMPHDEVLADQSLYRALDDISNANEDEWHALNDADRFLFRNSNLSQLSPAQIESELDLTEKLMMRHYLQGNFMGYPATLDSSFDLGPSNQELLEFHKQVDQARTLRTDIPTGPAALTLQRIKAAGFTPQKPIPSGRESKAK